MSRLVMITIAAAMGIAVVGSVAASANEGVIGDQSAVGEETAYAVGALRHADVLESLPAGAERELAGRGVVGVEAASSVKALTAGPWSLYLTPASDATCLSIGHSSGAASASCYDAGQLQAGAASPAGAVLTGCRSKSVEALPMCDDVVIYGLVPDGVTSVAVRLQRGPNTVAAVRKNVYLTSAALSDRPIAVSYRGLSGTVTRTIPLPNSG